MDKISEVHALKEWAVAVEALSAGESVLLLRKGGIREEGRHFRVAHDEVLLFPTYEHQKPHLLKQPYRERVGAVDSGWHPERIPIGSWARITDIFQVSEAAVVEALLPYHIWTDQFAAERFDWKPRHPLYLLLLRVYRLPVVQQIPFLSAYGSCKSWIDLEQPLSLEGADPALDDQAYSRLRDEIAAIVWSAKDAE